MSLKCTVFYLQILQSHNCNSHRTVSEYSPMKRLARRKDKGDETHTSVIIKINYTTQLFIMLCNHECRF